MLKRFDNFQGHWIKQYCLLIFGNNQNKSALILLKPLHIFLTKMSENLPVNYI